MDSGLSLDTSSEVFGEGSGCLALAVGDVKVRGGSSSVWGAGIKRAELRRERDGGDSFLDTVDSSIQQIYLHRTAFCALKHTRSSYKPAIYMDSGLSFDASSEVFERRTWPLQLEGVRLGVGAAVFGRRE